MIKTAQITNKGGAGGTVGMPSSTVIGILNVLESVLCTTQQIGYTE
jgi:hypothetical protein